MSNLTQEFEEKLDAAVEAYWKDVQEGLDDDLRDDSTTYDLVTDAFRAGFFHLRAAISHPYLDIKVP